VLFEWESLGSLVAVLGDLEDCRGAVLFEWESLGSLVAVLGDLEDCRRAMTFASGPGTLPV
jgi:hypothetical protein